MRSRSYDQPRGTLSCSARCPACNDTIHFWLTDLVSGEVQENAQMFMRPGPDDSALSITDLNGDIPDPVLRAMNSAIDSYRAGNLVATAVLCRRGLEDLMKYRLDIESRHGDLIDAIKTVSEQQEFAKPLIELAAALSNGSDLEKLCNMEIEPDTESAQALLEMMHSLIMYLYVLPDKLANVEASFHRAAA